MPFLHSYHKIIQIKKQPIYSLFILEKHKAYTWRRQSILVKEPFYVLKN